MTADRETLAWETELDRLELDILRTERLLASLAPVEAAAWETPRLPGPMPEHLLPRAQEIHERQSRLLSALLLAMRHTQRQGRLAARADRAVDGVPRYVDLTA